jgi:hypothetical protein
MSIKIDLFLNKLETGNLKNVLRKFLPTRYESEHDLNFYKVKKGNYIYVYIYEIALISLYCCKILWKLVKQKQVKLNANYKLLVYVPNNKYERFYNNVFKDSDNKSILVISDDTIDLQHITKNSFFDSRSSYFLKVLLPSYKFTLKVCYREFLKKEKKEFDFSTTIHLISTVTQSFGLKYLSNHTNWDKTFSLHPNGDVHYLLVLFFDNEMHSIRPDTTVNSKEHRHIKSDYLYYKSNFEKEVYLQCNLEAKLIKAGFLYDKILEPKKSFLKDLKVLFIDTCTNKNLDSISIRRKAINEYYSILSNENTKIDLYHKFHPGLLKSEKNITIDLLENRKVKILGNNIDITEFDIVIGFFSTLHHDVLCGGVCYIELTGEYNMDPEIQNPIHSSPIPKINNLIDLQSTFNQIQSNIESIYDQEIWNWYYRTYNIPNGKGDLKYNLLS